MGSGWPSGRVWRRRQSDRGVGVGAGVGIGIDISIGLRSEGEEVSGAGREVRREARQNVGQ